MRNKVRHIVMWNFKQQYSDEENRVHALQIKSALEGLADKVLGLVSIELIIAPMSASNRALMLDSVFESSAALNNYKDHPEHKKAQKIVHAAMDMDTRVCFDFEI